MAKFQAPEGFLFSEESGLYYSQIIATDENCKACQIVTWFNADTGEYTRQIYPIEGAIKQENTNQTPKNIVTEPKKSATGVVIFALICLMLIGVCIGVLWFTGNIGAGRDGNYDKLYATAEYKFKEGEYKTAAKFFKKIIKLDETEEYAYIGLANSYYRMGKNEKAAEALQNGYDNTQSSLVYDEMQKFTEITGISFDESVGKVADDDSEDSSDKGLFSSFGKKDKSDKKDDADDDSSSDDKGLFGKKDDSDDSKKSENTESNNSTRATRPEDVDYSRFTEIDFGYGTFHDNISGDLWDGFVNPERSNSGQSEYVIYDRYGGFLAELSAPSDFPDAEFHEYKDYCWWEFSSEEIWQGTITVSNYVTDERIRAYLIDASVYDVDMKLNGIVGYMYYEPIANAGIDCNFYGSTIYKMCYKLESDNLKHTCIVPYINSKGYRDFLYVEFTGNNYRFDPDLCLKACSEVFNFTTK